MAKSQGKNRKRIATIIYKYDLADLLEMSPEVIQRWGRGGIDIDKMYLMLTDDSLTRRQKKTMLYDTKLTLLPPRESYPRYDNVSEDTLNGVWLRLMGDYHLEYREDGTIVDKRK